MSKFFDAKLLQVAKHELQCGDLNLVPRTFTLAWGWGGIVQSCAFDINTTVTPVASSDVEKDECNADLEVFRFG